MRCASCLELSSKNGVLHVLIKSRGKSLEREMVKKPNPRRKVSGSVMPYFCL